VQIDAPKTTIICQPCDGLAEAIEKHSDDLNHAIIHQLVQHYLYESGILNNSINKNYNYNYKNSFTHSNNITHLAIDTLLLGCTHYPLIIPIWQKYLPNNINIVDNGAAVAKQLGVQLAKRTLLATDNIPHNKLGTVLFLTSLAGVADFTHLI
jgi:glutamate racemase